MYVYKKELELNNLQWVICYKTKANQIFTFDNAVWNKKNF